MVPGELTIITGVPNSGKSEWIDALLVNLAWQHGWCFAMCSMEKKVRHSASTALQQQCYTAALVLRPSRQVPGAPATCSLGCVFAGRPACP